MKPTSFQVSTQRSIAWHSEWLRRSTVYITLARRRRCLCQGGKAALPWKQLSFRRVCSSFANFDCLQATPNCSAQCMYSDRMQLPHMSLVPPHADSVKLIWDQKGTGEKYYLPDCSLWSHKTRQKVQSIRLIVKLKTTELPSGTGVNRAAWWLIVRRFAYCFSVTW